ncbi:MAG: DUF6153 family protein [Rhodoglobus sp.]
MSVSAIRRALRPRRALWRNLLVSLLAVTAIVAGLLTMHSLNLEHGGSATVASSTAAMSHHDATVVAGDPAMAATDSCGDPCAPEHSMTVMACILALLVSVLLIGAMRVITSWAPVRRRIATIVDQAVALSLPAPPSLHALCISRT